MEGCGIPMLYSVKRTELRHVFGDAGIFPRFGEVSIVP